MEWKVSSFKYEDTSMLTSIPLQKHNIARLKETDSQSFVILLLRITANPPLIPNYFLASRCTPGH